MSERRRVGSAFSQAMMSPRRVSAWRRVPWQAWMRRLSSWASCGAAAVWVSFWLRMSACTALRRLLTVMAGASCWVVLSSVL